MARDKLKTFTLYNTLRVSKEAIVATGPDGIEFTAEYTAERVWERVNSVCHKRFGHVLPHDLTSPARGNPSGLLTNNEAYPRDDCTNVTAPLATDAAELGNLIEFCTAELPGTSDFFSLILLWVGKIETRGNPISNSSLIASIVPHRMPPSAKKEPSATPNAKHRSRYDAPASQRSVTARAVRSVVMEPLELTAWRMDASLRGPI
jgi:hypothetical protein